MRVQVFALLLVVALMEVADVRGLCCAANNPFENVAVGTTGVQTSSALSPKLCGDCTYTGAFSCCATEPCNIFCCNCDGHCREGDCSAHRRNARDVLAAWRSDEMRVTTPGLVQITAQEIVDSADRNKDGKLSYEEAYDYLGVKRFNRVEVQKLDLDRDGFLTAEEVEGVAQ